MSRLIDVPGTDCLGLPVKIAEIDDQLTQLISGDDTDTPATKASILNLAVYRADFDAIESNAEKIAEITRKTACRSLLICSKPETDGAQHQAWVQAHCRLGRNGQKEVCSEQISFLLCSNSPGAVRNTVFSQLDSDLPVAFWWQGEISDVFEDRLYSRIDRLIFDSEKWQNPKAELEKIVAAHQNEQSHFRIHDLAFTRLNPYRQAIANAFDLPSIRGKIGSIREMKIRHKQSQRQSAVYLANWVANRLNLELDPGNSKPGQLAFTAGDRKLNIELSETDESFAAAILAGDKVVELSRCEDREFLRTRIFAASNPENITCEDWHPVRKKKDSELISSILERGGLNRTLPKLVPKLTQSLEVMA